MVKELNLEAMPILNGLLKYMNENVVPFHMPGHKENINSFEELEVIKKNLYAFDKTEVPGLDNLHVPEAMILEGQKCAARAFKARKSFFLVNGSTCGIYSMILGTTKPGDKVIIQRNSHRSVFMAAMLGELNVRYIDPDILKEFNIPAGIDLERLIEVMDANLDAKAVVITCPSYYGICSDLEGIVREAHKRNMLVLVDEAHGAHLGFNSRLPKSSMECGADAAVISLHKSLPALTQASILNVGNIQEVSGIKFMLRLFQSTSPSYILMASIDAARNIIEDKGESLLCDLIGNIDQLHSRINKLSGYSILDASAIGKASIYDIDKTKLVMKSCFGGRELERELRSKYGIQVEMSDLNNVTLITSIGDQKKNFELLADALLDIEKESSNQSVTDLFYKPFNYQICLNMRDAYYSNKKTVKLREAEGLISAEMVVPYPPGIPVLLPGELITREIINYIELIKASGIQLNGIEDETGEKIQIVI